MALTNGSLVYYDHLVGPGSEPTRWSAVVGHRTEKDGIEHVYLSFDGVLVPESHAIGIQGPNPLRNWLLVPMSTKLRLRESNVSDGAKMINWEKTVSAYKTKTGHYDSAKQRFASAKPGAAVKWETNETSWSWNIPPRGVCEGTGVLVSLHFDIQPGYAVVRNYYEEMHLKLEDLYLV